MRRGQVTGGRDGGVHGAQAGARALQLRGVGRAVEATIQVLVHRRRQYDLQVNTTLPNIDRRFIYIHI